MIKKRLVVKNGSYTNKDGQEKNSYVTIGHIHDGQYGEYITLESHINLAAFPRRGVILPTSFGLWQGRRSIEVPAAVPIRG